MMRFNRVALSVFTVLFGSCYVLAAKLPVSAPAAAQGQDTVTNPQSNRFRVFLLRFISAQDGIQFLADANITTASVLNDSNTVLVTAWPEVLVKAAALLNLVDSSEKYAVKALLPASEANKMPSADVIKAELAHGLPPTSRGEGTAKGLSQAVSIGTLFNPPGSAAYRVIIDVHDNKLIAVAPASMMEKLVAIAERVKLTSVSSAPQRDFNETGQIGADRESMLLEAAQADSSQRQPVEADKLFNELLDSIAEAQKSLAERAKETNQPPAGQVEPPPSAKEQKEPSKAPPAAVLRQQDAGAQAETAPGPAAPGESAAAETNRPEPTNPYEPQVVPNAEETLELALPEKLEIIPLLDLVGKYLNLNYVYNPQQLQGKEVYLKLQGPVKVSELYPLVESVLKFTGLAMTRKGNLVTIVPLADALEADPMLIEAEKGQVLAGDVVVTRIFQLNYVDPVQAKAILDEMKLGAVSAQPGLGTLIVTGYAYRMSRVEQMLEVIDKPGKPKQFKFRQLKFTMASTLAPKVKQLVDQLGDISITLAAPQAPSGPQPGRRAPIRRPVPTQPTQPTQPSGSAKPSIYLDADERTNRILMIGNDNEIAVVEGLIDALDVEQQDIRSIRVYEIQHVGADEVRKKLEELGVIGAGKATTPGRITARAARAAAAAAGQPGAPPMPTPTPAGAEAALLSEEVQVVIIESTNSLMVNASPEQHALIATIIAYVDSETIQQAIPYVVYPLENQNPKDLADVLNKLIQETILDKEGKIQQVIQRQEEQIVIVPDESTFSLIVFASKKNQEWISSLIKSMDRRRPQVLIDVTLVEVTKSDVFQYDLDLLQSFPDLTSTSGLTGGLTGGLLGTREPNQSNLVSRLQASGRDRFIDYRVTSGSGIGFYGDRHINALLTAMQTKDYGRILAKPKILVNDNESGKIVAKDTTYVAKTSSVVTSATSAQSNLIQTAVDYTGYDAGITLDIKPHISEGDLLRLEIAITRSDFVGTITGDKPPNTKASDITTVVTVPDGYTIILGGLIKLNQGKANTKVPLLGDIPIIGGLFRNTDNFVNDSKLYVFVKANILRPEIAKAGLPELVNISDKNRAAFEKSETEFQKQQDWPGIKPKPVDPVHVLDAE
jgi:type II secretory pathway component GspD/PulD (secretin)